MQTVLPVRVSEDLQRFSFKGVMLANDCDPIGKVPEVGSVWRFPSTNSRMNGWFGSSSIGFKTSESSA